MTENNRNIMDAVIDRIADRLIGSIDQTAIESRIGARTVADIRREYQNGEPSHQRPVEAAAAPRRRRRVERLEYVQTPRRKNAKALELTPNNAAVYNALHNRQAGVRAIMAATGLKNKAVQSSIWYLRNHDDSGNRLAAKHVNGPKALVNSVDK